MDLLAAINEELAQTIERTKKEVIKRRKATGYISALEYPLAGLAAAIGIEGAVLECIDRVQFGADVTLTVPLLLKAQGASGYMSKTIPELMEKITKSSVKDSLVKVEAKGIYINLLLTDECMFSSLAPAEKLGARYGETDIAKDSAVVVDYSSPNVAKHLHAGHIRSTIIGHVLSNIYEANGAVAHRVNHINDWGGFGFLLEAYSRWKDVEPNYENKNDFLYFLYTTYRQLEKDEDREGASFVEFKEKADARFRNLEAGKPEEVALWSEMVSWSLSDFNVFYNLIGIHPDYTIGESFYARTGEKLVKDALEKGDAAMKEGAAIVPMEGDTELVIRRSDESTIYATRDLAAIEYRTDEFDPSRMVYVVGQEQTDYFRKLFPAARLLGLVDADVSLEHVSFGFYISSVSKKKLSSREGAASVVRLISDAIAHFKVKYPDLSIDDAKKVAVGSIAFNDIKKDRMMAVELDTESSEKTIESFEESGGAYIMYAVARARSIMRKYGKEVPGVASFVPKELSNAELNLIKKISSMPHVLKVAAEKNNPAHLAEYLLRLAQDYNSFYEQAPVLKGEELEFPHRLVLTKLVAQVLENGLRICHMEVPERM